jgi:hypothetical protein
MHVQSMHIWYIWDRAAEKVLDKHKALVAAGKPANTTIVLDLPCPFLAVMTLTCMDAAQEAATALKFNRTLVGMARTIINGMKQAGVTRYNGAHLRCEGQQLSRAHTYLSGVDKVQLLQVTDGTELSGYNVPCTMFAQQPCHAKLTQPRQHTTHVR